MSSLERPLYNQSSVYPKRPRYTYTKSKTLKVEDEKSEDNLSNNYNSIIISGRYIDYGQQDKKTGMRGNDNIRIKQHQNNMRLTKQSNLEISPDSYNDQVGSITGDLARETDRVG